MRAFFGLWFGAYRGMPGLVWFLALITLINRAGTMVVPFVSIYVSKELGLGVMFAGQAMAAFGAGGMLGTLGGGWLTDRIGATKVLYVSLIGSGAVLWTLQYLNTPALLLVGLFILGLVGDAYRPAAHALLAAACSVDKRMRAFALNRTAVNMGMAVGPAMGGLLAQFSYSWLFRIDAVTCTVAGLLVFFVMPRAMAKAAATAPAPEINHRESRPPWRDGPFMLYTFLMLLFACIIFQAFSTYPIYLEGEFGLTVAQYGLLMTINAILITLFEMPVTHAVERKPPLWIVAAGVLFFSWGLAMLPLGAGFAFAAVSVVIWTIGEMLMSPAGMTIVADMAGEKHRGRYMGVYGMIFGGGHMIGPLLGSLIYHRWGAETLWFGIGVVGIIIALAFPMLLSRKHALIVAARATPSPESVSQG